MHSGKKKKTMGVMSRRVLPACGNICFFCCPSLRVRSRHPVKRYKQMLADIFPRNQVSTLLHQLKFQFLFLFCTSEDHLDSFKCNFSSSSRFCSVVSINLVKASNFFFVLVKIILDS